MSCALCVCVCVYVVPDVSEKKKKQGHLNGSNEYFSELDGKRIERRIELFVQRERESEKTKLRPLWEGFYNNFRRW